MTIYLNLIDDENKIIIKKNLIQINNKKRCSEFYFKLMKKKKRQIHWFGFKSKNFKLILVIRVANINTKYY